ncbi:MAG TPA: hypothetical protein VHJ17_16215, partial [Thermomonospora sp.]|nr:hypothetical protein [Thermomonospora sp.]
MGQDPFTAAEHDTRAMVSAGWWPSAPPQQRQHAIAGRMLVLPDGTWWVFGAWARWYRLHPSDGQWYLCPPPQAPATRMAARPAQQAGQLPPLPPHVLPAGPDFSFRAPAPLPFVKHGFSSEVTARVRATIEQAAALPVEDYPHWWALFASETPSTVAVTWGVMLWCAAAPVFDSKLDAHLLDLWTPYRAKPLPTVDGPRWLTPPPLEALVGLYAERLRASRVDAAVSVLRTIWAMASALRDDPRFQARADALLAILQATLSNPQIDYDALPYGDQALVQQWLTRCPPNLAPALRHESSPGDNVRHAYYELAEAVVPIAGDPGDPGYIEPRLVAAALVAADLAKVRPDVAGQVVPWLDPEIRYTVQAVHGQAGHPLRRLWPQDVRLPDPLRSGLAAAEDAPEHLLAAAYATDLAWCRLAGIPARPRGFPVPTAILAEIVGTTRARAAVSAAPMTPPPGVSQPLPHSGTPGQPGRPGAPAQPGAHGQPAAGVPGAPAYGASPQPGLPGQPGGFVQPGSGGDPGAAGQPGAFGQPGGFGGDPGAPGQPGSGGDAGAAGQPGAFGRPGVGGDPGAVGQPGGWGAPGVPGTPGFAGQQPAPGAPFVQAPAQPPIQDPAGQPGPSIAPPPSLEQPGDDSEQDENFAVPYTQLGFMRPGQPPPQQWGAQPPADNRYDPASQHQQEQPGAHWNAQQAPPQGLDAPAGSFHAPGAGWGQAPQHGDAPGGQNAPWPNNPQGPPGQNDPNAPWGNNPQGGQGQGDANAPWANQQGAAWPNDPQGGQGDPAWGNNPQGGQGGANAAWAGPEGEAAWGNNPQGGQGEANAPWGNQQGAAWPNDPQGGQGQGGANAAWAGPEGEAAWGNNPQGGQGQGEANAPWANQQGAARANDPQGGGNAPWANAQGPRGAGAEGGQGAGDPMATRVEGGGRAGPPGTRILGPGDLAEDGAPGSASPAARP